MNFYAFYRKRAASMLRRTRDSNNSILKNIMKTLTVNLLATGYTYIYQLGAQGDIIRQMIILLTC